MNRRRCYCPTCRSRDKRDRAERSARFWQVVAPLEPQRETPRLNLPAVPRWHGEPNELNLYRITRKGDA
jgi:hypothetical protein